MTGTTALPQPADIVAFWREAGEDAWFTKDEAFDARFRERFWEAHFAAARRSSTASWRRRRARSP